MREKKMKENVDTSPFSRFVLSYIANIVVSYEIVIFYSRFCLHFRFFQYSLSLSVGMWVRLLLMVVVTVLGVGVVVVVVSCW